MKNRSPLPLGRVLKGKRVSLRLPSHEELEYIQWLWSDPGTMKEVGGVVQGFEGERAEQWFARKVDPGNPGDCYCLIFAPGPGERPVGEVSFHEYDPAEGSAVFNVKVATAERGTGYGSDAVLTLLRFFFEEIGGLVMLDPLALDNSVGQRTLLALGFEQEASVPGEFMARMTRERFEELYGE